MSNPWAKSFDEMRAPYLQEKKAKKDYDGDGKVESGSKEHAGSVHNAIQKAKGGKADGKDTRKEEYGCSSDSPIKVTKKKKKKVEEKYDNTKSPDYAKKKKALAKKHGGAKNIKGHPQYEHRGIDIEHIDGSVTEITDVIKAPKMVAAPKLSNWREDFVWDEPVDEALKQPKLDIKEKGVKNKVEINPTVATEGYMSKDKEGHTTGGFRISDKEAKKAKERLKKKYKKEEVEQVDEKISASGYARAKKYREDQAREKNRRENPQQAAYFREVDKIKAAKAKRKDKAAKNLASNMKKEEVEQVDEMDGSKLAIGATAGIIGGGLHLMQKAKQAAERLRKKRTDAMNKALGEGKAKGLDGKACWDGYKLAGTKKKGGKTVDNCVKEEEKKNLDEVKVKYYSGQDRNPNTGLPKGLKATPIRTEKEVNKKLDRTTLAQSYEPEGEVVTELNRYEKETGKSSGSMNMPKGRPTKKGGTSSPVMRAVRTSIRKETGKPHGQKKKTKGEKGNRQYGDRKTTPADTIAKRRQSRADAEKLMRDTSGT